MIHSGLVDFLVPAYVIAKYVLPALFKFVYKKFLSMTLSSFDFSVIASHAVFLF
jgi:hypothetical protein